VARPRWDLTLATYVGVVPPSHLKGPLLQADGPRPAQVLAAALSHGATHWRSVRVTVAT
jgi:hypothetical protein